MATKALFVSMMLSCQALPCQYYKPPVSRMFSCRALLFWLSNNYLFQGCCIAEPCSAIITNLLFLGCCLAEPCSASITNLLFLGCCLAEPCSASIINLLFLGCCLAEPCSASIKNLLFLGCCLAEPCSASIKNLLFLGCCLAEPFFCFWFLPASSSPPQPPSPPMTQGKDILLTSTTSCPGPSSTPSLSPGGAGCPRS